jgi:hypothetical protein
MGGLIEKKAFPSMYKIKGGAPAMIRFKHEAIKIVRKCNNFDKIISTEKKKHFVTDLSEKSDDLYLIDRVWDREKSPVDFGRVKKLK